MQAGDLSIVSLLTVSFFFGLRHATEADHLAAVSTIVSEKKSLLTASIVGGLWGIGHTISLFAVGLVVILFKLEIPAAVEGRLEGLVGVMLVLLGLNALRKLLTAKKVHIHDHQHDGQTHSHFHLHSEDSDDSSHHRLSRRSVLIGMVHGLAGSAGLMLLVLPTIHSEVVALSYVVVFGLGSIGGMMLMSLLIGLPFRLTVGRFALLDRSMRLLAGGFSLILGCSIIYERLISV